MPEPMRIGLLCENYFPTLGGEQEHLFNLRRHLERPTDGAPPAEVYVIAPHVHYQTWRGPRDDDHVFRPARSVRVHGYGSASESTLSPRAFFALRRFFARTQLDLLHIHAPCDIGLPGWALATFDGPVVGTLHSYFTHIPIRTLVAPWYRFVMRRMTRVIAVGEGARDTIARYATFDCTIIGNGVDVDAFSHGRPMARFADGMTNILSVARLEQRNGIDIIIDAFALVAAERPDVRLILAGEGPLRAEYEAQAARLPPSIASRIVFFGPVWEERADLYASAHCYALAARKASFSILVLEALAAGLRVAALPPEGITCWTDNHWSLTELASAHTPAAYADALRRALAPASPDYVDRARGMADRYDWRHIVARIRSVYADAIAAYQAQRARA